MFIIVGIALVRVVVEIGLTAHGFLLAFEVGV